MIQNQAVTSGTLFSRRLPLAPAEAMVGVGVVGVVMPRP
jgi:hypothetical protein